MDEQNLALRAEVVLLRKQAERHAAEKAVMSGAAIEAAKWKEKHRQLQQEHRQPEQPEQQQQEQEAPSDPGEVERLKMLLRAERMRNAAQARKSQLLYNKMRSFCAAGSGWGEVQVQEDGGSYSSADDNSQL
jgi:hypothetical protein